MTGVFNIYLFIFSILIIGVIEIFLISFYKQYIVFSTKLFKLNILSTTIFSEFELVKFIFYWFFATYFSTKLSYSACYVQFNFINIYLLLLFLYFNKIWNNNFFKNNNLLLIFLTLALSVFIYLTCNDFITLLLIIETITSLYYFFFLKTSYNNVHTIIKYKNLISQYLWLSFFTLIFFLCNILIWIFNFGSVNFFELSLLINSNFLNFFILISFFWKLGVPLFHFYKLELYQFFDFYTLLLFSTGSLLINSLLYIYFLYILKTIFIVSYIPIVLVTLYSILFIFQGIEKTSFFYFLALSGINTWVFFIFISLVDFVEPFV